MKLQYPNGDIIGRKELKSLNSQFVKEMKDLKKYYTAHGKRKKRKRKEGSTSGFKNPILVDDNMRRFFLLPTWDLLIEKTRNHNLLILYCQ